MAMGLSNAEIGRRLFLAEATVKTDVARVLAKLGLRDRLQAVVYSYESGWYARKARSRDKSGLCGTGVGELAAHDLPRRGCGQRS